MRSFAGWRRFLVWACLWSSVAGAASAQELKANQDLDARTVADRKAEAPRRQPVPGDRAAGPARRSLWDLILASGTIGLIIILLSVAALALVFEHMLTIRRLVLMPPQLAEQLHKQITEGHYAAAEEVCKARPSYLAYVVLAGLQEVRLGYAVVEKAMEEASQEQASRLFRKVDYLALIANIAPMLGLLGTVQGILIAFKTVAETQGAAVAADLADGVYLALVTTVEGLVVAIPTLGAHGIFRSRIEQMASEVNLLAEQVFVNYKRSRLTRRHDQSADPVH
jgi:biopolymer transport protein ExbB